MEYLGSFVQNLSSLGYTLFQVEIVKKKQKYIDEIWISSPSHWANFQQTWRKVSLADGNSKLL